MKYKLLLAAGASITGLLLLSCDDKPKYGHPKNATPVNHIQLESNICSFDFTPDNQMVLSSGGRGVTSINDLTTGKVIRSRQDAFTGNTSARFSPHGDYIAEINNQQIVKISQVKQENEKKRKKRKGGNQSDVKFLKLKNIENFAFKPNNKEIALVNRHGKIQVIDIESEKSIFEIQQAGSSIVTWSPDGKFIAFNSDRNTLSIVEVATQKVNHIKKFNGTIYGLLYSPDGQYIALCYGKNFGDGQIYLINSANGEVTSQLGNIIPHPPVMAFSPDGKHFSYRELGNKIKTVQVAIENKQASDGVLSVINDEKGNSIAKARLLNKLIFEKEMNSNISYLDYTPDGKYLGIAKDKTITFLNIEDEQKKYLEQNKAKEKKDYIILPNSIESVDFSPDSKIIAIGMYDGFASLRNFETGKELLQLKQGDTALRVEFSKDGKQLIIDKQARRGVWGGSRDCGDKTITRIDIKTGKLLSQTKYENINRFYPFYKDNYIITYNDNRTFHLLDATNNEDLFNIKSSKANFINCSPDKKTIATTDYQSLKIWDANSRKMKTEIAMDNISDCLSFSPDSKKLAMGNPQGEILIIDAATGNTIKEIHEKKGINTIQFNPDNQQLAYLLDDNSIILHNINSGVTQKQNSLKPIKKLLFSPDGKYLASNEADSRVILMNTSTGKIEKDVSTKDMDIKRVEIIKFSPDSKFLTISGTISDYGYGGDNNKIHIISL